MIISETNPLIFDTFGSDKGVLVDYEYIQPFSSESQIKLQIQSNTEPTVNLIDELDNVTAVTITKVATLTNITGGGNCFLFGSGTETYIYFVDGVLPYYLKTGSQITITDGENNGTYTLTNVLYNDTLSAFVCVFSHTYSESTQQPTYTATYDNGTDIYECTINLTGLSGCYYIDIDGTQSNVFYVTADDELLHIEYYNDADDYGIMYKTGISFQVDVNAKLYEYESGGSEDVYTDDEEKDITLNSNYFRTLTFQTDGIENWMIEKFDIIFKHDNVIIDGVGYTSIQDSSINSIEGTNLFSYTIKLQEVEPLLIDDEDNFIIINDDNFLLPNANGRVRYA